MAVQRDIKAKQRLSRLWSFGVVVPEMQYSLNKEILVIISNSRVEYTTLFYCCEVAHKRSLASSYNEQHISRSSINMCTLDDVCVCERPLPPRINMCTLDDVCVCERPLPPRINMCTLDDVCVCERPLPRRNRRS